MPVEIVGEVTAVVEEYLECIYRLQEREGVARTNSLIKCLKVAPGTVTNTVERLERDGFVNHVSYRGVRLTEKGRRIALKVIRRHRLSERLLVDLLKMEWSMVHEAACRLEHSLTNDVEEHLERILSHPKTCPHGNPIPGRGGEVFEERLRPLSSLEIEERGVVAKFVDEDPGVLNYFRNLRIILGVSLTIIEKPAFDNLIKIRVGREDHTLSRDLASTIWVRTIGGDSKWGAGRNRRYR
ncbi:MAG: metal-dependent transcriptional regulator [Thermoproteota archaeon]